MTEDDACPEAGPADRDWAADPAPAGEALMREFALDHPRAKVWAALTDGRLLSLWLLPCDLAEGSRLAQGVSFSFATPKGGDGRIDCEVVELEPGRRLRLTWRTHADHDPRPAEAVDTLVSFEVEPAPAGGTRLRIRQAALPALLRGTVVMLHTVGVGPRRRRSLVMSAATLLPLAA